MVISIIAYYEFFLRILYRWLKWRKGGMRFLNTNFAAQFGFVKIESEIEVQV